MLEPPEVVLHVLEVANGMYALCAALYAGDCEAPVYFAYFVCWR